ncbi:MAG: cyclase family protein [Bacteroidetes bacterium]|nr:cyclase family protein [Bacteroidota bacterium]
MELLCKIGELSFKTDLRHGRDISLSFGPGGDNPSAFGIPSAKIAPIRIGDFVGSVDLGSGANCDVIEFCAHGNATHTECIGHITPTHENVGDCLHQIFFTADLITVQMENIKGESLITNSILKQIPDNRAEAIIIRTLPNDMDKRSREWSGNQPPYFHPEAILQLRNAGYLHLLTDLPSVDPEEDEGLLKAHHVWWNYPDAPRMQSSITELIFVADDIPDGRYLLNLSFPKIRSDASPSRPFLFPLIPV